MSKGTQPLRIKADLTLLFVAMLWGSAFAVQRSVSNQIGVFTFNGLRFLLAGLIIFAAMSVVDRFGVLHRWLNANPPPHKLKFRLAHRQTGYIILAGTLLFLASYFQQAGLRYTTAGNAGFITTLYVVLIPILLWIFWRVKIPPVTWASACLAVFGSLLLGTGDSMSLSKGDVLVFSGTIFWGLHVILIGIVSWKIDLITFAYGQYLAAGILNLFFGLWFEGIDFSWMSNAGWGIVFTALFSIALGYTLQIFAQRYSPAADAAIILSMEAVFAATFGFVFLGEILTFMQIIGCAFILTAIILTALRTSKPDRQENLEFAGVHVATDQF